LRRAKGLALRAVCAAALCVALSPQPLALSQSQPGKPIIVRIPQDPPKSELSGLADVLLGSLGLTGVIVVAAVLLGAVMAGVMFWVRSRSD
jgi:ABC-type phosphate transport system permease subunit